MSRFLKLEGQTIKEKGAIKKSLLILLFYYAIYMGFLVFFNSLSPQSDVFFPTLSTLSLIPFLTTIYDDDNTSPLRRLLPSLPFTRSDIFLGRSMVKLLIWLSSLAISYLFSLLVGPFIDSAPKLSIVYIGIGFSFLFLTIEHLSIHLKGKVTTLVRGGLAGGLLGMSMSSGMYLFQGIRETFPSGYTFMFASLIVGILLTLINMRIYQRRAL